VVASGVDSPPFGTHHEGAFAPGTTFAGYRIDALVGRGGMGVVYRALDLSLERPVALKLIAPELVEDERFRARFLREPRLAASLDHPNVIPIYEAGEHDGQLYLAMRFVGGSDLKSVLEGGEGMPPERALEVVGQVAGALDAAHSRALVHRDVKPANVLIDESGHAYLTDFGITKQLGGNSADTGRAAGTLDYLAPEQIRGHPVDARTDGYALACVLYECLAGAPPFRRATEAETLWAHMQEEPAPVQGHAALDPVLRRALSKDPAARYETCEAFVGDARAALGLGSPPVRVRRRMRLGRRLLLWGGLLLAAAVVAAILAITVGSDETLLAGPNTVAVIDPDSGEVDAVIPVGNTPTAIAASDEAVWVLNSNEGAGTISRIDPDTREVEATLSVPGTPRSLVTARGSLWVGTNEGQLFRIDPASDLVDERTRLPNAGKSTPFAPDNGAGWLTTGAGAVWAASFRAISRVDPATGALRAGRSAVWGPMAHGFGSLWVAYVGAVERLSANTLRRVATVDVLARPVSVATGLGSVWVPQEDGGAIVRIEPSRNAVERTYEVGGRSNSVAIGTDAAWATSDAGTVARIDPETHTVSTIRVGGSPRALTLRAGEVWVSVD
jgi:DNA-binding beta-propeller fold protein YncE